MSSRKTYPNYTLEEKIQILKKEDDYSMAHYQSIPPDYYLRLMHGFDRKDVENEQLRRLLLQNTNTLQNVVKETILELNKPTTNGSSQPSIDDLVVKHTKKVISKKPNKK